MAEAFIYMFFVSSGAALGVACITWISWKVVQRSNKKAVKKKGTIY